MKQMEIKKKQFAAATGLLGMAVLMILGRQIGDWGMTYLAAALEIYGLLQILFTACIPEGMSRLLRARMSKGQYKNAAKVSKAGFWYCLCAGIFGCALLLICADALAGGFFHLPEAAFALRLLAPLFLAEAVCAVLEGYFQGIGTAMPTVIAGILKQIFILSFSLLAAHGLYGHGEKVSALLHTEKFTYMYGAGGVALGMIFAGLLSLGFLFFIYLGAGRRAGRREQEGLRLTEDSPQLLRLLLLTVTAEAATLFLLRAGAAGCVYWYGRLGVERLPAGMETLGAFYAKFLLPTGFLTGIALLLCAGNQVNLVSAVKKEEYKNAKNLFTGGIQTILLLNGFFAVMNLVLEPGILHCLFGSGSGTDFAAGCMRRGFPILLFLPMGLYFMRVLSGLGKKKLVLLNTLASFAAFLLTVIIGKAAGGDAYIPVFALALMTAVSCILNGIFVIRALNYTPEWIHLFVMPLLAAAVTGLCLFLLNRALVSLLGEGGATLLGLAIGICCYVILLFTLRCVRSRELYLLPGGGILRKIGEILHILS